MIFSSAAQTDRRCACPAEGIILVPSGLFSAMQRVKDPEQVVAFMLAHAFSHVLRRHKTKLVQLSLVDSITIAKEYKQLYNAGASSLAAASDPTQLLRFTDNNVKSLMDQAYKSRNWLPNLEQDSTRSRAMPATWTTAWPRRCRQNAPNTAWCRRRTPRLRNAWTACRPTRRPPPWTRFPRPCRRAK